MVMQRRARFSTTDECDSVRIIQREGRARGVHVKGGPVAVANDPYMRRLEPGVAFCSACECSISADHRNFRRHMFSDKHRRNVAGIAARELAHQQQQAEG